jgi:hypothetical protein
MYASLSSLFEYEREGCPCRVNGGFTGGSAVWPRGGVMARSFLRRKLFVLQEFVLPQLTQDGILDTIVFQHDGASPHWALIVREFLDDTCNNHWCSRDRPMAREFPGLDAARLFLVGERQATCVWTKAIEWSWPPTDHRGLCIDHSGNAAHRVAQLVRAVWIVPRPSWRSCWVLMC